MQSKHPKSIEFKDVDGEIKAYILDKDNKRFLLPHKDDNDKHTIEKLPIRVTDTKELTTKSNDVINLISGYRSFKVTPQKIYNFQELVTIDNIKHSSEIDWNLWKIVCWAMRLGRANVVVSSIREWGKTSYPTILNYLLGKSFVAEAGTFAGSAPGLTENGVIWFDEIGDVPSADRRSLRKIFYQLGGWAEQIKSGTAGSFAHKTKSIYDTPYLSCGVLCNRIEDYDDKKDFFDYMFNNANAITCRFVPLRLPDGKLDITQFEDSHTVKITDEIKKMFLNMMKSAQYYYENWTEDVNKTKIDNFINTVEVKGRQMKSFKVIVNFIDLFADDDSGVFQVYAERLHEWYKNYKQALIDNVEDDEIYKEIDMNGV